MIALHVTLHVRAERREELLDAISRQGATSLELEPGCRFFDISVDDDDPNRVLLYEVYADREALVAHRETPHFAVWSAAADACVERIERTVGEIFAGSSLLTQG